MLSTAGVSTAVPAGSAAVSGEAVCGADSNVSDIVNDD